jgi:hypothetical protein
MCRCATHGVWKICHFDGCTNQATPRTHKIIPLCIRHAKTVVPTPAIVL